MISALNSALSGLQASQTQLDVSANNVANSSTPGFKSSRVELTSTANQSGVQVTATSSNTTQGPVVQTGNSSDLAINGGGYFEVGRAGGGSFFTRSGTFVKDNAGFLRTPSGDFLLGTGGAPIQIPQTATSFNVSKQGGVLAGFSNGTSQFVGTVDLATFSNANGLSNQGGNLFSPTSASGQPNFTLAGTNGAGTIESGSLELSNTDAVTEAVSQIVSLRSFEANARVVSTTSEMLKTLTTL